MFEVKREIYTCQKRLNKLKQSLEVNNKLRRTVADTRVQMDVIWQYFKGTDAKLHEAKGKTHSIKLFHSPHNKSNLHFSPDENSRKLWLWDWPVIGERTITTRIEVLNWILLQKKTSYELRIA